LIWLGSLVSALLVCRVCLKWRAARGHAGDSQNAVLVTEAGRPG
jgi:hypothetical protein